MRGRMVKIGAGAVAVMALAGGGVAWATGAGDDDKPLSGAARERAIEAALAHTKGGTVTETESGDDGAAYGVEVRLSDGRQVEVELDESFNVIGQEGDDDSRGENDGPNDD
jgi:Peptidase propeptide and YPEB domain